MVTADEEHKEYRNHNNRENSQVSSYFWQVVASVSSAAIVGIFFWLWNVTLDIRELQNGRSEIARVMGNIDTARSIIDRNSDRLTKIEAAIDQTKDGNKSLRESLDELRSDGRAAHEVAGSRSVEFARMSEAIRQLELILQSHMADERPNYRPGLSTEPRNP